MNMVCFICARGGSKGLANKNIVELCGKPLIAWSIEQALAVVEEVVVSADCPEIAKISWTAMQGIFHASALFSV